MSTRSTRTNGAVFRATTRTTGKRDGLPHENEDSVSVNAEEGWFAVSDGASTAARSEVWSGLLTRAFTRGEDPFDPVTTARLGSEWWEAVFAPDLPWFAHEKLVRGSAATLVGLRLSGHSYEATAIGDSCLFHIREGALLLAAPLDGSARFSRFTPLLGTGVDGGHAPDDVWSGRGEFVDGDLFLLATDAVSKRLLRHHEEHGTLWPVCDHVSDDEVFAEFVERERDRGLDNDDSTVCVVRT
ncbi:protein phosphatase 2C domain-containing protein [Umezawaea tangerina]|uniref:Serine/threonine protein phosphatase PrpC n=1 Tax=Umezawaea tangerina TaxID=84725 RepID=A0A2T0S8E3_9PSEU|nr:protein phosphatase 2C domain-containing protein [Umezawaea tangerina]PRY29700.1 serine/threonine protein phosphatase PrpC [Umezawaea tangerina]